MIKEGRSLVILDDMILDVGKFADDHPGGKFSLMNNIGREIGKFFHGGYSLEATDLVDHHSHSASAKKIAMSMVIGYLDRRATERVMKLDGIER